MRHGEAFGGVRRGSLSRAAAWGRRGALLLVFCLGLGWALTACSTAAADRPTVVVTTNILGDITRNIVGDQAEVVVLMGANADPHSFGISAKQASVIEAADLVIHNGGGLEENVLNHVEAAAAEGVPTLAALDAVEPLAFAAGGLPGGASGGGPSVGPSGGGPSAGGAVDPHFWTDPSRAGRVAEAIARSVAEHVDGVDAGALRSQEADYLQELAGLESWMEGRFGSIHPDKRKLITNHHVFGYLAQRFGFEVVGTVIPSGTTLASPSSADLNGLTEALRAAGVAAIFADSSQPERLARVLAEQ